MIIEITPLDTLFFRDGKPFSMGEDTWANGIFPPSPSVIYGALRTLYFANHMDEFRKFRESNWTDDPTANLKINGVYLKDTKLNSLLFPVPLDTVCKKNELYLLNPVKDNIYSHLEIDEILTPNIQEIDFERIENGVIDDISLKSYLSGINRNDGHSLYYTSLKKSYLELEPKIGIGRNKITHSSDEGALYRAGMCRLKNLSIIVDFKGLDDSISDKGFMKLGGEGRAVSYKKVDKISLLSDYKPVIKDRRFKLYLATPAKFENGWRPGWLENGLNGIKLNLLAAAVGKYITVGGFDMKGKPKKMYRAVPAGSVYYFEAPEGVDEQKIIETFHNRTISEFDSEKECFGLAFLGVI